MRRVRARAGWIGLLGLVAASCDLTPTLDVPLPEHEPRFVLHTLLVASDRGQNHQPIHVHVGISRNPYVFESMSETEAERALVQSATVELMREGQVVETLTQSCFRSWEAPRPHCEGPYRLTYPVSPGAAYTLRVRAEGMPEASATAQVPLSVEVSDAREVDADRVAVEIRDPADREALYLLEIMEAIQPIRVPAPGCRAPCIDSVTVNSVGIAGQFRTADPLLLAAARSVGTDPLDDVAFEGAAFEGSRAFVIEPVRATFDSDLPLPRPEGTLAVTVLDSLTYRARQATAFSMADENPFEEPSNLPSNVEGGYGLVGAAVLHERPLPPQTNPAVR